MTEKRLTELEALYQKWKSAALVAPIRQGVTVAELCELLEERRHLRREVVRQEDQLNRATEACAALAELLAKSHPEI